MGTVQWSEPGAGLGKGVDHLGMRTAGQDVYAELLDFTTTITWHPRYYSFFCWATRSAFKEAGGDPNSPARQRVDLRAWRHGLRRREYGMAAATLLARRDASRIAGSTKVGAAVDTALLTDADQLSLRGDHLQASTAGLAIYGGPLLRLGLLKTVSNFSVPLQRGLGARLADAYALAIGPEGERLLASERASLDALKSLGERARVDEFGSPADGELELLRETVLDFEGYRSGSAQSVRRLVSVGLLLEFRRALGAEEPTLALFREATLFGAVRVQDQQKTLVIPNHWLGTWNRWRLYQAHAYATLALEALLSATLSAADELLPDWGASVPVPALLDRVVALAATAWSDLATSSADPAWSSWLDTTVDDLFGRLESVVGEGAGAASREPDLAAQISGAYKAQDSALLTYSGIRLLALSVSRMRRLLAEGPDPFANADAARLPPAALIDFVASLRSAHGRHFTSAVIERLVIRQHRDNALRKLLSDPSVDTSKLSVEGNGVVPLSGHAPGTSNPRFANALMYLSDLGYLGQAPLYQLTSEGAALLNRLQGASP